MSLQVTTPTAQPLAPRVLVVDDEPTLVELVDDVVSRTFHCQVLAAKNLREARQILSTQAIELLVADVNLPDGDGMSLLPALRASQPNASAIVITGAPSMDGAITALRQGAVDFVPKPFSAQQICDHVKTALERQRALARHSHRLKRLREAVRRLNESRKIVSRKVDLLCNDLISAYGELSRQLDAVRTQEGFRKYVANARDLEQLLCHTMDWLLRQIGYSNVAIWLAAEEGEFQLGAYMKYTITGEQDMIDAMRAGLVQQTLREGMIHLVGDQVQERLTPQELDYLADQAIVSINCTYLSEPLAVVVLFRDDNEGFSDDDVATLKQISPLFAVTLAEAVRGSQKYTRDDNPFYTGDDAGEAPDSRHDAADWWKRGEDPPF